MVGSGDLLGRERRAGPALESFWPALSEFVVFYAMMPLTFWDSTLKGLSCLEAC